MTKIILSILLNIIAFCNVSAAFRNLNSARAIGMGEAFSTLATETSGLYWNPGGLGDLKAKEFSALYAGDGLDSKYTFISYGQPLKDWGGAAFCWSRFSNEFEKTNNLDEITGTGNVINDEFAAGLGYCRDLPVSFGFTAKFSQETIDNLTLNAMSLNSGILCEVEPMRFALVVENLFSSGLKGNSVISGTIEEKLPVSLRLGISFFGRKDIKFGLKQRNPEDARNNSNTKPKMKTNDRLDLNICTDFVLPADSPDKSVLNAGMEIWFNRLISFRLGSREIRDFSTGLSVNISKLRLDYAFVISRYLEKSHVFSMLFFF